MPDEPLPVRRKIGPERRHDWSEHAANAFADNETVDCGIVRHFLILLHRSNFSSATTLRMRVRFES